jgi:hypothetical protein
MVGITDIAWVAGLLEGEGTFSNRSSPTIRLTMTDGDVVRHAATLVQAKVSGPHHRPKRRPYFVFWFHGAHAAAWMMTLWPFMGRRRRIQLTACLKRWRAAPVQNKKKTCCKNGHPLSGENVEVLMKDGQVIGRRCATCRRRTNRAYKTRRSAQISAVRNAWRRTRYATDATYREHRRELCRAWSEKQKLARQAIDNAAAHTAPTQPNG